MEAMAVLDSLVELYKVDVTSYFHTAQAQKGGRSIPRFNYTELSKKIFDSIPAKMLASLYIGLFDVCDTFAMEHGTNVIVASGIPQSQINLRDLVLSVILPYQLPHSVKRDTPKKDGKKAKPRFDKVPPRCSFSIDEAKELFKRFLPIPLPYDAKQWRQMKFILMPDRSAKDISELGPIAKEAVESGNISFAALSFLMQDSVLSVFLGPEAILHALYIGPLKGSAVELFASNKSKEYRKQCREQLAIAERARGDEMTFVRTRPAHIYADFFMSWTYKAFIANTSLLLNDLKGVRRTFTPISPNWAYAAIKKFGKRTYVDKTWREECLYDLIWTVLVQRPHMKKYICDTLEKDFHDYGAAKYWRKMQPAQMDRVYIRNRQETNIDLLEISPEFLNFTPDVQQILMVSTPNDLVLLRGKLAAEVYKYGQCHVGLDAEWSAFTGESKATILQLALRDSVYIIDIDALESPQFGLKEFFTYMFMESNIVKIGFQFGEDLLQLRNAVQNCRALFEPKNVVCVGKIIVDLLEATEKREDSQEIINEVCPNLSNDKLNDSIDDNEHAHDENCETAVNEEESSLASGSNEHVHESAIARTINKGLSTICEQLLGRPLDKREQCSVWDRRPLRQQQIRYAAMDAFCLLMLFDVCAKWAERLDTTIDDLVSQQPPMRSSLPLFSDDD